MPFTIVSNDDYLEINWTDDDTAISINLDEIKREYKSINIDGQNNNEFEYYQILNRSKQLEISQCTVDLSHINGNFSYISLINCTCLNNISECSTHYLYLKDAKLSLKQLYNFQIDQLSVCYSENSQFNLYNEQLTCQESSLSLIKQQIDLTQLQGRWEEVQFDNCMFNGQVDNNQFQAKDVNLMINEENCRNNLDSLENLTCQIFTLSQTEIEQHQIYLNLAMSNTNNQKINMSANFENVTIDLDKLSSSWHKIQYINCRLIGNPCVNNQETKIFIQCNEQFGSFDLIPLKGIKAQYNLEFVNNQIDFQCLQECKPNQVKLMDYNLYIDQLCGTWNILWLQQCNITQSNTSKKVVANQVKLTNMQSFDSSIFNQIEAQKLEVDNTKISLSYPNVRELIVNRSYLNISEPNDTISRLYLNYQVKLIRFSILQLNSLEFFNSNVVRDDPSYKTKEEIIKYLRYKKKNKNTVKNYEYRVFNELKRIQVKQIHVKRLLNSFNICYQLLQTFVSNYE
ncbi:Hypothetical_protein [Hexamita inflata]|uniref:Hypothetical_protein n=1 Tax=Hexamita inflata TaxID=28002 RepID=A0AA86NB54_9EUKA|nr:Hypothetical protein HINF_LOCUS3409 [Hexamita inflata]